MGVFWYLPPWIWRKRGYFLCPVFYRERGVHLGWQVSVLPQKRGFILDWKVSALSQKRGRFELKSQCFATKRGSFSNWRTRIGTIFPVSEGALICHNTCRDFIHHSFISGHVWFWYLKIVLVVYASDSSWKNFCPAGIALGRLYKKEVCRKYYLFVCWS